MLSTDIEELHHFITEIENLTSNQSVLNKCKEAKAYIQVLAGAVAEPSYAEGLDV